MNVMASFSYDTTTNNYNNCTTSTTEHATLQVHDHHDFRQRQQRHVNCSTRQWGCGDEISKIKGAPLLPLSSSSPSKLPSSSSSIATSSFHNDNIMTTCQLSPTYHYPTPTTPLSPNTPSIITPSSCTTMTKLSSPSAAFPYSKKERTTYVAGGSSYSSFPVKQLDGGSSNNSTKTLLPTKSFSVDMPPTTNTAGATITTQQQHKPFRCNECGQTFSRSHNLKSHSATHSLVRPYKCDTCGREFRRLHDLKRHQKLHTGERPYVCPTCDRSFSRLDALNRHLKAEIGCDRSKHQRQTTAVVKERKSLISTSPPSSSISLSSKATATRTMSTPSSPPIPAATVVRTEPRRSSAPTPLPSLRDHQHHNQQQTLLPPIRFSSYDSFDLNPAVSSSSSSSPSPVVAATTIAEHYHQTETDQLRRQIHDLQVENRLLRSLVMSNNAGSNSSLLQAGTEDSRKHRFSDAEAEEEQQQQQHYQRGTLLLSSSPTPMDWRKSL